MKTTTIVIPAVGVIAVGAILAAVMTSHSTASNTGAKSYPTPTATPVAIVATTAGPRPSTTAGAPLPTPTALVTTLPPNSINGQVRLDGAPLAGVVCSEIRPGGALGATATTSSDGTFTLPQSSNTVGLTVNCQPPTGAISANPTGIFAQLTPSQNHVDLLFSFSSASRAPKSSPTAGSLPPPPPPPPALPPIAP